MTDGELARAVAALIRDSLYVNDGSLKPCVCGILDPRWVQARSANAATVIADLFDQEMKARLREAARGEVVTGEIGSRYFFDEEAPNQTPEETMEEHAGRVIK